MKINVLLTLCLAFIASIFSGFMVREREEALTPSVDYYLLQGDKSFTVFVSNLQKMEALIYVPKNKITDVRTQKITPVSPDMAVRYNKMINGNLDKFVQLYPSDRCSEEVLLNFRTVSMVTFVSQEKIASKPENVTEWKLELAKTFPKVEAVSINATKPEELQIKMAGSRVWQSFVPVNMLTER